MTGDLTGQIGIEGRLTKSEVCQPTGAVLDITGKGIKAQKHYW